MYDYLHGGNPDVYLKKFNIKKRKITDFSLNLNPLGIPPALKINWSRLFDSVGRYPSCNGDGVVEFYEERFGIDSDNVVAGNGSVELIYLAPKALDIRTISVMEPSFYDYRRSFELAGCRINPIYLKEENSFEFTFNNDVKNAMDNSEAIILGRPNNPTGGLIKKDLIIRLAKLYKDKWFLIDEAFIQFSDDFEHNSLMDCKLDNVIVFHSLTKFYALAGLRVGALIASKRIAERFKTLKQPWSVNAIAENAVAMLKSCNEYEKSTISFIKTEKERIKKAFYGQNKIKLFKTSANFFLAKWNIDINFDNFLKYLLENGFFVRDCRNFKTLENNFFRFAVLDKKSNDRLIELILDYE